MTASLKKIVKTFSEMRKMFRYRSNPGLPFYYERIMRALIHPVSKLFADSIMAHTWDWVNEPHKETPYFIEMETDPLARPMKSLWDAFKVDTGAWRKTYLLSLPREAAESVQASEGWQFAYHQASHIGDLAYKLTHGHIRKLRVVFDPTEKIKVLAGPHPFRVYAKSAKSGEYLPLIVEGPFDRSDPRFSEHSLI